MGSGNRSSARNVLLFNSDNVLLGGLRQNGSITHQNFLQMVGILIISSQPFCVHARVPGATASYGPEVLENGETLSNGEYVIDCPGGEIYVNDELWFHRTFSQSYTGRETSFRKSVRARDRCCVLTHIEALGADHDDWTGFEMAHIFPLAQESYWTEHDYGWWILGMPESTGVAKINAPQNGILLESGMHKQFDEYLVSVNPDDGNKIVCFRFDVFGVDGNILHSSCRQPNSPSTVSDSLLRWHFRQSVLANMRGAGEPIFDHDFPLGEDMVGVIAEGPMARERFETELNMRLRSEVGMW